MRVVFLGTPDFAVPALDALVAAGHEIAAVYSQPPRPAGRGQAHRPSPVHARALELNLIVRTPVSLRDDAEAAAFAALGADVAVVVAYGLILPGRVLAGTRLGCLNIHASDLPRWRGAAPVHRAIMSGDTETAVCIMQMEAGLDTGPVLLREGLPIAADDTSGTLSEKLSKLGARLIVRALADLDRLSPVVQSADGVSYAHKIDKAEARIDWTRTAAEIDRQIRGLSPFPGAWTLINGIRVKLLLSQPVAGSGLPGQVLDGTDIACGTGAVRLLRLQREGKAPMDAGDFQRGTRLERGDVLGAGGGA